MKKLTKTVLAIMCTILLAASVAGCTKSSSTTAGNITKVTVWTGNGHDKDFLNQKVTEWNDTTGKELGIAIDYIVKEGGNLTEMLDLAFTSGQAPDLFTGGNLIQYTGKDYLAAYEDLQGGKELVAKFSDKLMENRSVIKGKTYCLPRTVTTYGLIYNKDMFKAAGLVDQNGEAKPPETYEELRQYAKVLTNVSKQEYGIVFPAKWSGWYGSDINQAVSASCGFVDGYNPATGLYDFSSQAELMRVHMGIKADGSFLPGAEGLDNDPARAKFAAGGIGMKYAGSFDYGVLTEQFPAKINWGVAPMPVADKDNKYKQFSSFSTYLKINKKSVETIGGEKLMAVLKWFHSNELLIEAYKEGMDIPYNWDIVKNVELGKDMENWKEFAKLVSISASTPLGVSTDMTGERPLSDLWLNDIWSGKVPVDKIDDVVDGYTKKKNTGIAKYKEIYPEYDSSPFILPDWNVKR